MYKENKAIICIQKSDKPNQESCHYFIDNWLQLSPSTHLIVPQITKYLNKLPIHG